MNKIEKKNLFGIKEVPDIFLIDENGEIVYCFDSIKTFRAKYCAGKWEIKLTSALFSDNLFFLWKDSKIYNLYCRTYKRSYATGKDIDFCFKFDNVILKDISINLALDGDPCDFPMRFVADELTFIDSKDCPEIILSEQKEKEIIYPVEEQGSQD